MQLATLFQGERALVPQVRGGRRKADVVAAVIFGAAAVAAVPVVIFVVAVAVRNVLLGLD